MTDQHRAPDRDAVTAELADRLWRAEAGRAAIDPISETWPDLTIDDAYAIQTRNVERRRAAGRVICGRKVGLTSRPMQEFLRVFEPTFGVLLDDMFVDDGDEIALEELIQPRVEAEIAFVMCRDLVGPGITTTNALTAIAGVLPAIEVGDSRIADWRIQLVDTVADNASSGRLVLGGKLTAVTDLDLSVIGMVISRNGALLHTGAGAAVLGNPARCVAWLANKLASFGAALHSGDVVLSGALHRLVPVLPGDVFRAEFGHLGAVTTHFSSTSRAA
jgi:2-keto-4-pentenoate hydratase